MEPIDVLTDQLALLGGFGSPGVPGSTEDLLALTVGDYRAILDMAEQTIADLPFPLPDSELREITGAINETRAALAPFPDSQVIGEISGVDLGDGNGGGTGGGDGGGSGGGGTIDVPTQIEQVYADALSALNAQAWTVQGGVFQSPQFTADVVTTDWSAFGPQGQVLYSGQDFLSLVNALSAGWSASFVNYISNQAVLEQGLLDAGTSLETLQELAIGDLTFAGLAWNVLPAAVNDLLNGRSEDGTNQRLQFTENLLNAIYDGLISDFTDALPGVESVLDGFFLGYRESGDRRTYESGFENGVSGTDQSDVFFLTPLDDVVNGGALGDMLLGVDGDDNLNGGDGIDHLFGGKGNDSLTGGPGDDDIHGGEETEDLTVEPPEDNDTAFYLGDLNNFTISLSRLGDIFVTDRTGAEGSDRLIDVETLVFATGGSAFADGVIDLTQFGDIASLGGAQITEFVELYIAYFNRAPDAIGLNFWGTAFANGVTLEEIAALFLDQEETRATYPSDATNLDFATEVYTNVLGRDPDQPGLDFWVPLLDSGGVSRGTFILEVLKGAKVDAPDGSSQEEIDLRAGDQAYLAEKTNIGGQYSVVNGLSDVADAIAVMDLFVRDDDSSGEAALARIAQELAEAEANGEFLMPLIGFDQFDFGTDMFG